MNEQQVDELNSAPGQTVEAEAGRRRMLYRHSTDKLIGGVCGGVAEFLGWNPVLVRVFWAGGTLFSGGGGVLVYLLLALFLPVGTHRSGQLRPPVLILSQRGVTWTAGLLMGGGALWLLANLGILPGLWGALWALVAVVFWPAVLIGAGYLLLRANGRRDLESKIAGMARQMRHGGDGWLHRLQAFLPVRRSRDRRILSGVCGGLGEQIGIDPNLLRLLWIALTLGTFGGAARLYVAFALLLPEADLPTAPPQEIRVVDGSAQRMS